MREGRAHCMSKSGRESEQVGNDWCRDWIEDGRDEVEDVAGRG